MSDALSSSGYEDRDFDRSDWVSIKPASLQNQEKSGWSPGFLIRQWIVFLATDKKADALCSYALFDLIVSILLCERSCFIASGRLTASPGCLQSSLFVIVIAISVHQCDYSAYVFAVPLLAVRAEIIRLPGGSVRRWFASFANRGIGSSEEVVGGGFWTKLAMTMLSHRCLPQCSSPVVLVSSGVVKKSATVQLASQCRHSLACRASSNGSSVKASREEGSTSTPPVSSAYSFTYDIVSWHHLFAG